jgi:diphthamide biosynthesis methyltransferase
MTILKSNSGKMLEYLTIELNSGWDVDDLADALLVDKWTVEEIEKLTYKEITKAVKESIVYNGRAKIEDAYQDIINYKTNHKLVVNIINNLVPELSTSQRGSLEK